MKAEYAVMEKTIRLSKQWRHVNVKLTPLCWRRGSTFKNTSLGQLLEVIENVEIVVGVWDHVDFLALDVS